MILIQDIRIGMEVEVEPWPYAVPTHARDVLDSYKPVGFPHLEHRPRYLGIPIGEEWADWRHKITMVIATTVRPTDPDQLLAYLWTGSKGRPAGWYTGPERGHLLARLLR